MRSVLISVFSFFNHFPEKRLKNTLVLFAFALLLFSVFSCKPEDEIFTVDPSARLSFSTDTVLFDTVFVTRGSITKRLLVYNPNDKAVKIDEIKLGRLGNSEYKLWIDGAETSVARHVELRGKDSLYIHVEVSIDPRNLDSAFLVKDSITFLTNKNQQHVKLIAYGQDAFFHTREEICNTTWSNSKPHVIVDTVYVKPGCTLTIEEGAQIFSNNNAVLLVDGTLIVNGTKDKRVHFRQIRREKVRDEFPGQWEGIRFLTRSGGNVLRHTEIRNALYGIQVGNPGAGSTTLENCIIKNMSYDGILAFSSEVKAVNTVVSNCGRFNVAGFGGGKYEFIYCTFANYSGFNRQEPLFVLTDYIGDNIQNQQVQLQLVNSIIWGNIPKLKDEFLYDGAPANFINPVVRNNIIKTDLYKTVFNTNGNILNLDPEFRSPAKQDFRLDTLSPANGAAFNGTGILKDLLEENRNPNTPDIGAYEKTNE